MHDVEDRRFQANIRRGAPGMHEAFVALNAAVFGDENAQIPRKYRELMAVAVAVTTQCPFCIQSHSTAAAKAGASEAELAEAVMVAAALRAGGAVTHGFLAMKYAQHAHAE